MVSAQLAADECPLNAATRVLPAPQSAQNTQDAAHRLQGGWTKLKNYCEGFFCCSCIFYVFRKNLKLQVFFSPNRGANLSGIFYASFLLLTVLL